MTRDSDATYPWEYRVAQNPRWFWLVFAVAFSFLGADSIGYYFTNPGRHTLSHLPIGIGMALFGVIAVRVGGYTQLRSATPRPPWASIPSSALWSFHIPTVAMLISLGTFGLLEYLEPHMTWGSRITTTQLLLATITMYATTVGALLVRGHMRQMRFTPTTLEYARGWFSASVPWDEIVDLTPVCDANRKNGGIGDLNKSTVHNFRAGIQLTVGPGATTRGIGTSKAMMHFAGGHDVIHVDCSEYRIDPNTLINAIYLLTHNPELRRHLDCPSGAEIFTAPSWNMRRKMRVGDTWNRQTNEIISSSDERDA